MEIRLPSQVFSLISYNIGVITDISVVNFQRSDGIMTDVSIAVVALSSTMVACSSDPTV